AHGSGPESAGGQDRPVGGIDAAAAKRQPGSAPAARAGSERQQAPGGEGRRGQGAARGPAAAPARGPLMSAPVKQIDFKVMGREFRVGCTENEERQRLEAVAYVDRRMLEMRDKSKVIGLERIAIMTALSIASELLHTKVPGGVDVAEFKRRIHSMQASIDNAMAEQEKLF